MFCVFFLCTVIWPKHVLQKFAATTFGGNLLATPRVDLDLASEKLVINTHLNTHSFMRLREKNTPAGDYLFAWGVALRSDKL